jgi:hypothetical protein
MFNLCYLVICMTLQQCREYRNSLTPVLPDVGTVDVFYWLNPEQLSPDDSEFSLTELVESNSQLSRWEVVNSEAGSWLPWYHYMQDNNVRQCSAIVRLDNGFVFRDTIDNYEQFFTTLAILSASKGDVLLNLEAECSAAEQMGVDGANILVDLSTMQQLLSLFQQQNVDEDIGVYSSGAFAHWLAPYAVAQTYTMKSKDLTYCAGVQTVTEIESDIPEEHSFIRLSRPLNVLGTEHQVNALAGATGILETVF